MVNNMATLKKRSQSKEQTKEFKQELNSSAELKESKKIENTPFTAHKYDDKWIVTVGRYRCTPALESYEQAVYEVHNPNWDILSCAMVAMIEAHENNKQLKTN